MDLEGLRGEHRRIEGDIVIFNVMAKFRHKSRKPIHTNNMSFERARRAESNDTKIRSRSQPGTEI